MDDERLLQAAWRVMNGDDSGEAAHALEAIVLARDEDERFEELIEALALYSPADGPPYTNAEQLRAVIRDSFDLPD